MIYGSILMTYWPNWNHTIECFIIGKLKGVYCLSSQLSSFSTSFFYVYMNLIVHCPNTFKMYFIINSEFQFCLAY